MQICLIFISPLPLSLYLPFTDIEEVKGILINNVSTQPHPQHGGQAGVGQQCVHHRHLHQERGGGQPGGQDRDGHRGQDSPGGGSKE